MGKETTYDAASIDERLADLPHWRHADGVIERTYVTSGWRATLMVIATIGHLCEAGWHHADLAASYDRVTVKLSTHSAKGITDKDFAMARKIEEVVAWQPGKEGSALTGPPANQAYLKHGA
jgi:4a-hydroxytetrahydrobiopterin dehydratase